MMKLKNQSLKFFLILSLLLTGSTFAIAETIQSRLAFHQDSLVVITDTEDTLKEFATAMASLKAGKDTVIRILHIGDSHIQAGFLTGRVMRLLHDEYGNAGRGWIAPFKLSKTNEPFDYFINSTVKEWITGRCVQNNQKCPVGPGGIGLETEAGTINFNVGVTPKNGAGYSFNKLLMYRHTDALPMEATGRLKDLVEVNYDNRYVVSGIAVDTFRILCQADTLSLRSLKSLPGRNSKRNLYYGFEMHNGRPGILYHSIGVNGAMFVNYTSEEYTRQLALLKPDIVIISLGTNETFGRRFNQEEFTGQVQAFVNLLKRNLPDTPLLLTTPPECYKPVTVNKKRNYVRNQQTVIAARSIVRVSKANGLAYWDMFTATGGENSCENWYKDKWMGSDRIHFNQDGYAEQGTLFFQAITKLIDN